MRIVSLLASGTEIVCALGLGANLVGRSHECDNPPWVRGLPCCSEPAFDVSASSREIDREVSRRIRSGEPLYRLDTDLIRSLAPDLILTQAHCDVCAVTPADVERSGVETRAASALALSAGSLDGVFDGMLRVAEALGKAGEGRALVSEQRRRLEAVRARTAGRARPTVAAIEWIDPMFAMGNWGPELVEFANGVPLLGKPGEHSRALTPEQLAEADPDYVIVAPCGFDLARTLREKNVLETQPWWNALRAVRAGHVAFADGNLFFNRSGVTAAKTAEIIAEMLHGAMFGVSARGTWWR